MRFETRQSEAPLGYSFVLFIALLLQSGTSGLGLAAEQQLAEESPQINKVTPAEFGAGAVIEISGTGFLAEDRVYLDTKALDAVRNDDGSLRATVPAKLKKAKTLRVKRGKKTIAISREFTFVKAPRVTNTRPKFGVPRKEVVLYGLGFNEIAGLEVAGQQIPFTVVSGKKLRFTVPEGLASGVLTVSGVGGEASLRKEFEVFVPPSIDWVEPSAGFKSDTFIVHGDHLETRGVRFYLGKKPINPTALSPKMAHFSVPKGATSGQIKVVARKIAALSADEFVVHKTPVITSFTREVGSPGSVVVRGKHLDQVEGWTFGDKRLDVDQTYKKNGSRAIKLLLPEGLAGEALLNVTCKERTFSSKKTLSVIIAPEIGAVRFGRPRGAKKTTVVVMGRKFTGKTKFFLGSKKLTALEVHDDTAVLETSMKIRPKVHTLKAKTGRIASNKYKLDGRAQGYTFGEKDLTTLIEKGAVPRRPYTVFNVVVDLDHMHEQFAGTADDYRTLGTTALKDKRAMRSVESMTEEVALNLMRLMAGQYQICRTMESGKENGTTNTSLGRLLEQVSKEAVPLLNDVLKPLWSSHDPHAFSRNDAVQKVDKTMALIWRNQDKNVAQSCQDKFYGSKPAGDLVDAQFKALQRAH